MQDLFFPNLYRFSINRISLTKIFAIFISLTILAGLFLSQNISYAATSDEPYSVLVVAGQSNAQGDNSFFSAMNPPIGSHPADSATKIMWSTGDDQFNVNRQDSSTTELLPLTSVQPFGYFGPEIGLARNLWDQGRRNMVILKVTYGLQRLAATPNGTFGGLADWNTQSIGESYDNLKLKKNQLASIMQTNGDKYSMDGFYWVQGESDAVKGETLNNYQNNLTSLLNSIKADLGMHPDAVKVIGKISGQYCLTNVYNLIYNPEGCGVNLCILSIHPCSSEELLTQGNNNVRQAIQNIADSDPKIFAVETEDLARVYDFVHMSSVSQLTLGRRMSNSGFVLPYREEGSNDYDDDGILNADEDANGNANLGDDDSDLDGIPNYLDSIVGAGGGRTLGIQATKLVEDNNTGNESVTSANSVLNWNYSISNNATSPATITVSDELSSRQSYINGSLLAPPNFIKSYSTNNGNDFSQTEPLSGTTNVKVQKTNVPVSAKGDATQVLKQAGTYDNSTTSNEGYIPILLGSRIFTLFNNTYAGIGTSQNRYDIGCVEKDTGTNCSGYPMDFTDASNNTDFISPFTPVHYLDKVTGRIFTSTQRNSGYGIACFDTTINAMCSGQQYTELTPTAAPVGGTRRSRIAQVVKIGSCLYTYDLSLKVYSYDPSTGSTPCSGHTTKNLNAAYGATAPLYITGNHSDYGSTAPLTQAEVNGTKMYITMNYAFESNLDFFGCNTVVDICKGARIICFDSTTSDGRCSNGAGGYFTNPLVACYQDRFCKLQQPFIDKRNNAICAFSIKEPGYQFLATICRDPLTGASVGISTELDTIRSKGWEAADFANYLPSFEETTLTLPNGHQATIFPWKKAYLIASPRSGKAVCFDWTANALCAGFGNTGAGGSQWDSWTNNGVTSAQVGLNGDTNDIGYVSDNAGCIWAKGKSGDTWSFDAQNGSSPCRRFKETVTVQPQQYYCGAQLGQASGWNQAKLQFPVGTSSDDLSELSATVKDQNGNAITGYTGVDLLALGSIVSTKGIMNISGLSLGNYPSLSVEINFKAINNSLFSGANATPLVVLTFSGDDPQVCYQTRVENACNITAPLTNVGMIQVSDQNLDLRQLQLSATTVVQYEDGESCIPDIRVTTSSPPGKIFPGQNITYEILVENTSNSDPLSQAASIALTNIIPAGTSYVSSDGGTLNGDRVSWPTFGLAGSTSRNFQVSVVVGNVFQGSLLNTVNAQLSNDPTESNNTFFSTNEIGAFSSIGTYAWNDSNRDGIHQTSEPHLNNVPVKLYKGGVLVASGQTNSAGKYEFQSLLQGVDYIVKFEAPINWAVSRGNIELSSVADDPESSSYETSPIALAEGEKNESSKAGFYSTQQTPPPTTTTPTTTTTTTPPPTTTTTIPDIEKVEEGDLEQTTQSTELASSVKSSQATAGFSAGAKLIVGSVETQNKPQVEEKSSKAKIGVRLPVFGDIALTGTQTYYATMIGIVVGVIGVFSRGLYKRHLMYKRSLVARVLPPKKYN